MGNGWECVTVDWLVFATAAVMVGEMALDMVVSSVV